MTNDFIESSIRELKTRQADFQNGSRSSKGAIYWVEGPDTPLGAQYKCQIARMLAQTISGVSLPEFCRLVEQQQNEHIQPDLRPRTNRGLRKSHLPEEMADIFDWETYLGWLKPTGRVVPDHHSVEGCVESVLLAADHLLRRRHLKPGRSIREVLVDFRGTARAALSRCVERLYYQPGKIDFRYIASQIHGTTPDGPARDLMRGAPSKYREMCSALQTERSVQIVGPDYSGKLSMLRRFVHEFEDGGFETATGSRISIFAISLHQTEASEAIDLIAQFYREALGLDDFADGASDPVAEIASLSRQFPAMFVIAGLDAVDGNEVVRAMYQDAIGEVISSIVDGHPETRLLASMSAGGAAGGRPQRVVRHPMRVRRIVLDEGIPPINYLYRAVRQCAASLCRGGRWPNPDSLRRQLGDLWVDDAQLRSRPIPDDLPERLGQFVCDFLLDDDERCCLGMVALSHDGLLSGTVTRIFTALRDAYPDDPIWGRNPTEILGRLPREVVRQSSGEPDRKPRPFVAERALRDALLAGWSASRPSQFRTGCWGIARAAADHARALRAQGGAPTSVGRDSMVIILLLGGVENARLGDDADGELLEHVVLPALDATGVRAPNPRTVVQFAFQTLFRRDLAASAAAGMPALADARLRLAVVLPFLDNRATWLDRASVNAASSWRVDTGHAPWVVLGTAERLSLLLFAAAAAVRLNLSRVITACARTAEGLTRDIKLDDEQLELLGRIQRYELDFAILLGRNPDAVDTLGAGGFEGSEFSLKAVDERALALLHGLTQRPRTPAWEVERRKFQARHAELLHLGGDHDGAYWAFADASDAHPGRKHYRPRTTLASLTGRSRRMFIRLLVEMGRAQLYGPLTGATVLYRDGLCMPILHRAETKPSRLRQAERLVAETLRSLNAGSVNDWIGVKIDQARLQAVQSHYANALRFLDQARRFTRNPNATRDIVLEYLSVQGRTLTDAAAFTMAVAGTPASDIRETNLPDVGDLAAYMGVTARADAHLSKGHIVAVSSALCARAQQCAELLRQTALLPDRLTSRYVVFADYLDVWLATVRSRQTIDLDDRSLRAEQVYAQLTSAGERFERVLQAMVRSGYLMARREAELLRDALVGAGVPVTLPAEFPIEIAQVRK